MKLQRIVAAALTLGLTLWAAVFFAIGLGVCSAARAEEGWAVATLTSYHVERRGQNEVNPGVGAEKPLGGAWRAVGGVYRNSSTDTSVYAGALHLPWRFAGSRLGGFAALVTGYEHKVSLMGALIASLEGRHVGANLGFIPAAGGVLFFQVKWRFG